jgi:SnoaL-like protein
MSDLAQAWADLWNGELSLVESIVHEDFVSHAAPLLGGPPQDHVGRVHLTDWVRGAHENLPGLKFTVQVGPIVQEPFHVLRWHAEAGAISFYGTDILRVVDGKIAEYWANADSLWAAQQLGVVPAVS